MKSKNGHNGNGHQSAAKASRARVDPATEQRVILSLALGWKGAEVARIYRLSRSLVSLINRRHLEKMEGASNG